MTKDKKHWLLIAFIAIAAANLFSGITNWTTGTYLTKPFLMTALSAWFYLNVKNNFSTFSKYILSGLLFSIAGDTFLMFANKAPRFFLFGLGSFLITHLFYIAAFIKYPNMKNGLVKHKAWVILPVVVYLFVFSWVLFPDLPHDFKIPVLTYGAVISTMLALCINMHKRVSNGSSLKLIFGAILFVVSDSVIAVGKFKAMDLPPTTVGLLIMSTYLTGQYLIAKGSAESNNSI